MSPSNDPKWLVRVAILIAMGLPTCFLNAAYGMTGEPPSITPDKPAKPNAIDLRPKFRLGTDRRVVLKQESSQTAPDTDDAASPGGKSPSKAVPPKGAASRITSTSELTLVFRPTQVTPDGASVDIIIEAIRASRHGGETDDTFDSAKPAPKPASKPAGRQPATDPANDLLDQLMESQSLEKQLRPLVGEKMTMKLNPDGDILEVRGGETLAHALAPMGGGPELLGGLSPASTPGAASSKDLFKSIVGGPGKTSASVGESWETRSNLDLSILGQMSMRTRSTLSSFRSGLAQLDIKGQLEPSSESPTAGGSAPKVDVTYGGTCLWDAEDGFVRSSNTRQLTTIRLNSTKPTTITAETTTTITTGGAASPRRAPSR